MARSARRLDDPLELGQEFSLVLRLVANDAPVVDQRSPGDRERHPLLVVGLVEHVEVLLLDAGLVLEAGEVSGLTPGIFFGSSGSTSWPLSVVITNARP